MDADSESGVPESRRSDGGQEEIQIVQGLGSSDDGIAAAHLTPLLAADPQLPRALGGVSAETSLGSTTPPTPPERVHPLSAEEQQALEPGLYGQIERILGEAYLEDPDDAPLNIQMRLMDELVKLHRPLIGIPCYVEGIRTYLSRRIARDKLPALPANPRGSRMSMRHSAKRLDEVAVVSKWCGTDVTYDQYAWLRENFFGIQRLILEHAKALTMLRLLNGTGNNPAIPTIQQRQVDKLARKAIHQRQESSRSRRAVVPPSPYSDRNSMLGRDREALASERRERMRATIEKFRAELIEQNAARAAKDPVPGEGVRNLPAQKSSGAAPPPPSP